MQVYTTRIRVNFAAVECVHRYRVRIIQRIESSLMVKSTSDVSREPPGLKHV